MENYNNVEATNRKFLEAIGELNKAFQDERSDLVYYEYLANMAPTDKEKEILYSIVQEDRINATLLRRMYEELSGIDVSWNSNEKLVMPESYLAGISEAINRESREIEHYKVIREGFPAESSYIYTLSDIIANELKHIQLLNSILSSDYDVNDSSKKKNLIEQHTANFTLEDWARFIRPLVSRVLSENGDTNTVQFFRKLILSGILIGLGNRPLAAIELVERWQQNQGNQSLRMCKMSICNIKEILS
ncbi:MAG: hypothetical protein K0R54_4190 [Clostridiaceae bacterium]|jgi:rubrerythrin|nr:hypothetical protein [Clostridiaceae bacterium]